MEKLENIKEIFKNESESYIKFLEETYNYYKLGNNEILELKKGNKLSITKTLWFDDETKAPEKTIETFKKYNECNNDFYDLEDNVNDNWYILFNTKTKDNFEIYTLRVFSKDITKSGWMYGYCENSKDYIKGLNVEFDFENRTHKEITENQALIEKLHNLIIQENKIYNERLEKYFKRYNDHISISGYWANR